MKKNGFTLAEVLITLTIIGVIAAVVMPTLMTNYQCKSLGVKLSKLHSTLENGARAFVVGDQTLYIDVEEELCTDDEFTVCKKSSEVTTDADKASYKVPYKTTVGGNIPEFIKKTFALSTGYKDLDNLNLSTGHDIILKDGSKLNIKEVKDTEFTIDDTPSAEQTGSLLVDIKYSPEIKGLPAAFPSSFTYTLTEFGYVFPANSDECTWELSRGNYNTSAEVLKSLVADGKACAAQKK